MSQTIVNYTAFSKYFNADKESSVRDINATYMNLLSILRPGNDINLGMHTSFHMSTENLDIGKISVL